MKTHFKLFALAAALFITSTASAQNEIQTLFGKGKPGSVTGYGAISNKFSYLGSSYANLV